MINTLEPMTPNNKSAALKSNSLPNFKPNTSFLNKFSARSSEILHLFVHYDMLSIAHCRKYDEVIICKRFPLIGYIKCRFE